MRLLVLGLVAACGRVDFDPVPLAGAPDSDIDALVTALDAPEAPDAPDGALTVRQREHAFGFSGTSVTLPQNVRAGSALVAIALAQQQPILTITDSLGHTWTNEVEATSGITGSKVLVWHTCNAFAGAETVTVTPSFDNGPVHVAVVEIANAASACVDQVGDATVMVSQTVQTVDTDGPLGSDGQVVVAGFGAWFDEVAYTAASGDTITVSARPTPPAPEGDTLALVTSTRSAGPQAVTVTADHPTLYAAAVISIR